MTHRGVHDFAKPAIGRSREICQNGFGDFPFVVDDHLFSLQRFAVKLATRLRVVDAQWVAT